MTLTQSTVMYENYSFVVEYYKDEFNDVDGIDIIPTCNGGAKLMRDYQLQEKVFNHVVNTIINL